MIFLVKSHPFSSLSQSLVCAISKSRPPMAVLHLLSIKESSGQGPSGLEAQLLGAEIRQSIRTISQHLYVANNLRANKLVCCPSSPFFRGSTQIAKTNKNSINMFLFCPMCCWEPSTSQLLGNAPHRPLFPALWWHILIMSQSGTSCMYICQTCCSQQAGVE